jgi:hypothetical protein
MTPVTGLAFLLVMESWRNGRCCLGRYFDDPVKDKEEKANHTWKYLIHAGREKMPLDAFTKHVNEHQGGTYEPSELRTVLEKLQRGD